MKQSLLICIMVVLLIPGVLAFNVADIVVYYDFDNDTFSGVTVIDQAGNYNATNHGAATGSPGILGSSYAYTKTESDYVSLNTALNPADTSFSVSFWMKTSYSGTDVLTMFGADGTGNADWIRLKTNATAQQNLAVLIDDGTDPLALLVDLTPLDDSSWHHIVLVRKAPENTFYLYLDGSLSATNVSVDSGIDVNTEMNIGRFRTSLPEYYDGYIDEFAWFDTNISSTDVSTLYNGGVGLGYDNFDFRVSATIDSPLYYNDNFINASCIYEGSPDWIYYILYNNGVVNKTENLTNEGYYCYQETANNSFYTDGSCSLSYDGSYTFQGTDSSGFENNLTIIYKKPFGATDKSIYHISTGILGAQEYPVNETPLSDCWNYNTTHFVVMLKTCAANAICLGGSVGSYSKAYCYNGTEWVKFREVSALGASATSGAGYSYRIYDGDWNTYSDIYYNSVSHGYGHSLLSKYGDLSARTYEEGIDWYVNSISGNITFQKSLTIGDEYIFSCAVGNTTTSSSFYNSSSVFVEWLLDGNLTFNLSKLNGSLIGAWTGNISIENIEWSFTNSSASGTNNQTFPVITNHTFNYSVNVTGYGVLTGSVSVLTGQHVILNLTLAPATFVDGNIYDELNQSLILEEMEIEVISGNDSSNYTTTTGLVNFSGFYGDIIIRYRGDNYPEREYYLNVDSYANYTVDLYAIRYNDSVDTLVTVRDTSNQPIQDAVVKLLRYYVSCNCYEIVEMSTTGSDGVAYLKAQSLQGHYKWVVQKDGTTYFSSSEPEILVPSTVTGVVTRTFILDLGEAYYNSYVGFRQLGQDLTLTFSSLTNTTTMVYGWNDAGNVLAEVCLKAEYLHGVDFVLYQELCDTSSAGSLVMVLNNTDEQRYKYTVTVDSGTTYSEETSQSGWTDLPQEYAFGDYGYFVAAIFVIVLVTAMSFSAVAVTVAAVLGITLMSFLGIAPFSTNFIIGLIAMAVGFTAYLYRQG